MTRAIVIVAFLALAGARAVHAQAPLEPVSLGQRVRITTSAESKPIVGVLRQVDDRQLVIDDGKGSLTSVPTTDVRKIQVSTGRRSNVKRGFIIGALLGAALGIAAIEGTCGDGIECTNTGGALAGLSVVGGAAGALVGAPIRTERWRSVPFDTVRSRLDGPRPQLSLTLRF
jgi:hypothetical protein